MKIRAYERWVLCGVKLRDIVVHPALVGMRGHFQRGSELCVPSSMSLSSPSIHVHGYDGHPLPLCTLQHVRLPFLLYPFEVADGCFSLRRVGLPH